MRKILLLGIFAVYCYISNAQNAAEMAPSNVDTTQTVNKNFSSEERISKLEVNVSALKKENENLKKQMNQVRSALPNAKRKITVSRTGSKQVIVE